MRKEFLAFCAASLLAAGCAEEKGFRVEVEAPAVGTQEITVVYTTSDGNRSVQTVASLKGRFGFEGRHGGEGAAVVELYGANKRRITALLLRDGDDVELRMADSTWTVSGSDLSAELLGYRPGSDPSALSEEVGRALPLLYGTTEAEAAGRLDSLELLIARDSVRRFGPEGVWVFTAENSDRTRALRDSMRRYEREGKRVRDVFVSSDTAYWRMITRGDSATWVCGLLPDAPLALRGVADYLPCIVEADSAGRVVRVQRLP